MSEKQKRSGISVGFTTALMILVIVIALVLGGTMLWQVGQSLSSRAQCASNLRVIGKALLQYSNDHDETLPPFKKGNEWQWTNGYLKDRNALACPALPGKPIGYAINPTVSGAKIERAKDRAIYWDGVQTTMAKYWQAYEVTLKNPKNQQPILVPGIDLNRHGPANVWCLNGKTVECLPKQATMENPIFEPVLAEWEE